MPATAVNWLLVGRAAVRPGPAVTAVAGQEQMNEMINGIIICLLFHLAICRGQHIGARAAEYEELEVRRATRAYF